MVGAHTLMMAWLPLAVWLIALAATLYIAGFLATVAVLETRRLTGRF
jgi:hypothetical protein